MINSSSSYNGNCKFFGYSRVLIMNARRIYHLSTRPHHLRDTFNLFVGKPSFALLTRGNWINTRLFHWLHSAEKAT